MAKGFLLIPYAIPPINIDESGFIYIFLYNRSESTNWVYFDNLSVTHEHSPIVAGGDYYPYGLPMEGREITDEPYRYGYQGQFSEKDLTAEWNDFELRMYDVNSGRWLKPDPYRQFNSAYLGMGNHPASAVDVNGGYIFIVGVDKALWLNYLTWMYNTPLGKEFLDNFLNNPHQHLYFGFGNIPNTPTKITYGLTTFFPANAERFPVNGRTRTFDFIAENPEELPFENTFHNQPVPNFTEMLNTEGGSCMALILVDRADANTAVKMLDVIAHESIAHGTGLGTRGHYDPANWGVEEFAENYKSAYPVDSEAFRFRQEADVLLRVKNITRTLAINAAGKILTREMMARELLNGLPRHR